MVKNKKEKDIFYKKKGKIDKEVAQDILDSFKEGEKQGFSRGFKEGREGVIKEIEEKFADQYGRVMIRIDSKEWEGFKNNTSAYQRKGNSLSEPLKKEEKE